MVIDQVGSHIFRFLILTRYKITFDKQLHTSFLIHRPHIRHFFLSRYVLNGKFQIVYQHLENGILACRFIVLLRHLNNFRHQRYVTEQQCLMIVTVSAMEVSTSLILVAYLFIQSCHLIYIRKHSICKFNAGPATVPKTTHGILVATALHTVSRRNLVGKVIHNKIRIRLCI